MKGVSRMKDGRFLARIGKAALGCFASYEEACERRRVAEEEHAALRRNAVLPARIVRQEQEWAEQREADKAAHKEYNRRMRELSCSGSK